VSALFYSFSVLGLAIILVVGGTFIIMENTIEALTEWFDKRPKRRKNIKTSYTRLEWQSNTTLQLHRLAYEVSGYGTWQDCTGTLPVTLPGETLGLLDVHDPQHPRIEHAGHELRTVITGPTIDTEATGSKQSDLAIRDTESQEENAQEQESLHMSLGNLHNSDHESMEETQENLGTCHVGTSASP
jgi:hypothetical protein